jgi:hypothetical protein
MSRDQRAALPEHMGWMVVSALAFGVGMLLGGRACAPEPEAKPEGGEQIKLVAGGRAACEPIVQERIVEVEGPTRVIYECPPEPPPPPAGPGEAKKNPPKKQPPEPAPELDPRERQKLLAWVREQSSDLKACRDDRKDIYRLAVWMYLDPETHVVRRVDLNVSQGELPSAVAGCIRQRISRWKPPAELTRVHHTLVFGLTL